MASVTSSAKKTPGPSCKAGQHDRQENGDMDAATREVWQEVQFHWDSAYRFKYAAGFHATRRDNGETLTAYTPQELADLIRADYNANRVSRDKAP
jgi:hypothetical protein